MSAGATATERPAPRVEATPAPRIAFLRVAAHPIPNRLLPPRLEAAFPGSRVDVLDVGARVRANPLVWLLNGFFMLAEHGANLLSRRLRPRQSFLTTRFMFRRMSRAASSFVERGRYGFSIQIQSLFDGRAEGTPHFVYTDHTHLTNLDYPDFDRRLLRGPGWLALERRLYEGAARVFSRSQNVSRTLTERYGVPAERVACVGAGSNAKLPEPSTSPARARHDALVLFVGVDWQRKGGPELLEAFRRVRAVHPHARLRIVGTRPPIDEPGVEVLGRVPLDEMHRHYQDASIFCLPSRREPFGVAYVEAMHHGLPVIGARIGAVPELVEDGVVGYVVEPGDTDALAARLEALVADPALARAMGERAQARARERYTWEAVAERLAAEIRLALGGAPA